MKFKLFVGRDDQQAGELLMLHAGLERQLGSVICVGHVWIDSAELVDGGGRFQFDGAKRWRILVQPVCS